MGTAVPNLQVGLKLTEHYGGLHTPIEPYTMYPLTLTHPILHTTHCVQGCSNLLGRSGLGPTTFKSPHSLVLCFSFPPSSHRPTSTVLLHYNHARVFASD